MVREGVAVAIAVSASRLPVAAVSAVETVALALAPQRRRIDRETGGGLAEPERPAAEQKQLSAPGA